MLPKKTHTYVEVASSKVVLEATNGDCCVVDLEVDSNMCPSCANSSNNEYPSRLSSGHFWVQCTNRTTIEGMGCRQERA